MKKIILYLMILILILIELFLLMLFYTRSSDQKNISNAIDNLRNKSVLQYMAHKQENQFVAFVRVKNEIKTIEACLNSIQGVFDRIVIIHSNEPDDGSVQLMTKWCTHKKNCEIHEYPHAVIPSHDPRLKKPYNQKNSLAAYYNFGLTFFKPDDWIVKIDADQVYVTDELKNTLTTIREKIKQENDDHYLFGIQGYNTYPYKGKLVKYGKNETNGGTDSFIIKRKYIKSFLQRKFWEQMDIKGVHEHILPKYHWFHFMKSLKKDWHIKPLEQATPEEIKPLTEKEAELFNQKIRPLLIQSNSPYQNIKL